MLFRSILFHIGIWLPFPVFFLVMCAASPFVSVRKNFYVLRCWIIFTVWWLKISCGVTYSVDGLVNIPAQPSVIISNHQSPLEICIMAKIFPAHTWVLKRELLSVPIYGWALFLLSPIAINRYNPIPALQEMVNRGKAYLAKGLSVVVFPEGTRVPTDKKNKYHAGGALLADKAGAPILPVAHNAGYFWARSGLIKRPGTVEMVIGEPVNVQGGSADQVTANVRNWIENTRDRLSKFE